MTERPKKTILTICPSWPGQFKSVINACSSEYNIVAVCQIAKPEYIYKLDNVTILHDLTFNVAAMHQNAATFALGVIRIKDHLKSLGLKPDLAIIQVGFGLEILSDSLFPDIPTIGYFEWYETENHQDPFNMLLNTVTSDYASRSSALIVPSRFQRQQFPVHIRRKMLVVHEGIDTNLFCPPQIKEFSSDSPFVITYVCRGLESIRCFLEFIHTLKLVMISRKQVIAKIVGEDKAFYETTDMSYKAEAIKILGDEFSQRVEFLGVLNKEGVRDVLQTSDVHIYFTKPRGISWSLLEAMSCGCVVISTDTDGLKEVTDEVSDIGGKHCLTTDHNNFEATKNMIVDVIDKRDSSEVALLRRNARSFVLSRYDSTTGGQQWKTLVKSLM